MGEVVEFDGVVKQNPMLLAAGISVLQIETDVPPPTLEHEQYHIVMTSIEEKRDVGPRWDDAPEWAMCRTQNANGAWYWWNTKPVPGDGFLPESDVWVGTRPWQEKRARWDHPNPNWRDSMEMRPEPEIEEQPCVNIGSDEMFWVGPQTPWRSFRSVDGKRIETRNIENPTGVGITTPQAPLHFVIATEVYKEMRVEVEGVFINGELARDCEVVEFLVRFAERNARKMTR